jgi:hypothetical protein
MTQGDDHVGMTYVIVLLLLIAVGPLAIRFGADSRLDDHRR